MLAVRLAIHLLVPLALAGTCCLTGCGSGATADVSSDSVDAALGSAAATSAAATVAASTAKARPLRPKPVDPVIVLHTSAGDVQIQLFREKAPQTVDNFLHNYALRQYYDGTIFHHVDAGSMIIGGGYTSDLAAKETRSPVFNEAQNGLKNTRGMVAMIRDPASAHSATSQFFINLADNPSLDCQGDPAALEFPPSDDDQSPTPEQVTQREQAWGYCVFGQVIAGLEVVDRIAQVEVKSDGDFAKLPTQPITINSIEQLR